MKKIFLLLFLSLSVSSHAFASGCENPPPPAINEYPGCHGIYVGVISSFMIDPIGAIFRLNKISKADDLLAQAHAGYGCELNKFQKSLKGKHHLSLENLSKLIVEMDENKDFCTYEKDSDGAIHIDADTIKTLQKKVIAQIIQDQN